MVEITHLTSTPKECAGLPDGDLITWRFLNLISFIMFFMKYILRYERKFAKKTEKALKNCIYIYKKRCTEGNGNLKSQRVTLVKAFHPSHLNNLQVNVEIFGNPRIFV